ncbi:MAG: SEL1-like repeat protein [Verrucomicrobiota bacterium]
MKTTMFLAELSLLCIIAVSTGCKSTSSMSYQPTYTTTYPNVGGKVAVALGTISDKRDVQPAVYYQNSRNGDTGQFDRPVAETVREAISTELQRAGHEVSQPAGRSLVLDCEILSFQATMSEPPFRSPVLDLAVSLRFEWKDAKANTVLAANERSEQRSRKTGYGHRVKLPFDAGVVKEYGAELVNDMLPRVIEKELLLSPVGSREPGLAATSSATGGQGASNNAAANSAIGAPATTVSLAALEKDARAGNAAAMFLLGCDYYYGQGVTQDYARATNWFLKAADKGDAQAMFFLGSCSFEGKGVPADYAEALKWFRKAAELGQDSAMDALGLCYQNGLGIPRNLAEAAKWYRRADDLGYYDRIVLSGNAEVAKQHRRAILKPNLDLATRKDESQVAELEKKGTAGDAEAMVELARCYSDGDGVPGNPAAALKWYSKAADLGNAKGMQGLGSIYAADKPAESFKWYRKAADLGDATSMLMLGLYYAAGKGVSVDEVKSLGWFRKAADLGDNKAMMMLGCVYHGGIGTAKDLKAALQWTRRSAEQGNDQAMWLLGLSCEQGDGIPEDPAEAAKWYRKAADLGNADAQYSLARCYVLGNGVQKDEEEHLKWLRKAAFLYQVGAVAALGKTYAKGWGVPVNHSEAIKYLREAVALGSTQASRDLAEELKVAGVPPEQSAAGANTFSGMPGVPVSVPFQHSQPIQVVQPALHFTGYGIGSVQAGLMNNLGRR